MFIRFCFAAVVAFAMAGCRMAGSIEFDPYAAATKPAMAEKPAEIKSSAPAAVPTKDAGARVFVVLLENSATKLDADTRRVESGKVKPSLENHKFPVVSEGTNANKLAVAQASNTVEASYKSETLGLNRSQNISTDDRASSSQVPGVAKTEAKSEAANDLSAPSTPRTILAHEPPEEFLVAVNRAGFDSFGDFWWLVIAGIFIAAVITCFRTYRITVRALSEAWYTALLRNQWLASRWYRLRPYRSTVTVVA